MAALPKSDLRDSIDNLQAVVSSERLIVKASEQHGPTLDPREF
jgi:hypothetical protein